MFVDIFNSYAAKALSFAIGIGNLAAHTLLFALLATAHQLFEGWVVLRHT